MSDTVEITEDQVLQVLDTIESIMAKSPNYELKAMVCCMFLRELLEENEND